MGNSADTRSEKQTIADVLASLAFDRYKFFRGSDEETYFYDPDGARLARPLKGGEGSLEKVLAYQYYLKFGKVPNKSAVADCLNVLEGSCIGGASEDVYLRVGQMSNNNLVYDLGHEDGKSVILRPGGWHIEPSPIWFRRNKLVKSQVLPDRGGSGDLSPLFSLVNCDEEQIRLVIACLVACFFPHIAHPVITIIGEQGTAKTSFMRLLVDLIDPTNGDCRTMPKESDWVQNLSSSWVVPFDNITSLSKSQQDGLCRAVTGDSFVTRKLYTDKGVSYASFRSCVMMTGIALGQLNGDLADRMAVVELDTISPKKRITETQLKEHWRKVKSCVFTGLLDLVCRVLEELPNVPCDGLPRLADAGKIFRAIDRVNGWGTEKTYMRSMKANNEAVIENSMVGTMVKEKIHASGFFLGTYSEFYKELKPPFATAGFPKTSRLLHEELRRLAPALRSVNVVISDYGRSSKGRLKLIYDSRYSLCPVCGVPVHPANSSATHAGCVDGR